MPITHNDQPRTKRINIRLVTAAGAAALIIILIFGTVWMGRSAGTDTESAARSVSLLYLDEPAGRREQVVENNLQSNIQNIETALELMTDEDLSDMEHLQAYRARTKNC